MTSHSPPGTRGPLPGLPDMAEHKAVVTPRIIVSPSAKSNQTSSDKEEVAFGKLTISESVSMSDDDSDSEENFRRISLNGALRWPSPKRSGDDGEEPMDLSKRPNGESSFEFESLEEEDEEPVYHGPQLPQSDFIPIPLLSGAEGGEGKCVCTICNKVFPKPSALKMHLNIHYFERPYKCDACAVSFRTRGHLQKHKRSVSHFNKVNMNQTFGAPTEDNPRPFKCTDCKLGFRIHGHLAKHLRSKLHIMKLECLSKLPFGMYAEMERSGINLNEIDTTDCENSLVSLQALSRKIFSTSGMQPHNLMSAPISRPYETENISDEEDFEHTPPEENHQSQPEVADHRERSLSFTGDARIEASKADLEPVTMERRYTMCGGPESQPQHPPPQPSTGHVAPESKNGCQNGGTPSSFATRSNTCHICGQVLKSVKFLQVHLYSEHS